jgi:hypothetical protein
LQAPKKFTQNGIFGLKKYHLASLNVNECILTKSDLLRTVFTWPGKNPLSIKFFSDPKEVSRKMLFYLSAAFKHGFLSPVFCEGFFSILIRR